LEGLETHKALETKGFVQILSTVVKSLQSQLVPPRGLETTGATSKPTRELHQMPLGRDAQSGAFAVEAPSFRLTPEALAAALLGLSQTERAWLAAMLLGHQRN
jgi:hypothetical protein